MTQKAFHVTDQSQYCHPLQNCLKIIYKSLLEYLETNNLLDKKQHRFRPGKSTVSTGFAVLQNIVDSIDKGEAVVGVFFNCHVLLIMSGIRS